VIDVVHFTDPGCPWAYSASPFLTALHWRYGDGLRWRHVMIGLAEEGRQYVDRGYTPVRQARGYRSFRARGMPFATQPRDRITGTSPACRALVAIRLHQPARLFAAFRALQFGWFTTSLLMDDPAAIRVALARVDGLDVEAAVGAIEAPDVRAAYEADREEARRAAGTPTEAQGKAATTDGPVRYTAPSLVFGTGDGRRLEAGGFQPLEAYDVCVMNLDPTLPRRDAPGDVVEILLAFPDGVTTREVAQVLATGNAVPDDDAAEDLLIEAAAMGRARREPLGDDALWLPA
jgi:2-hydroxychromene-2-carboxylate isomerase